MYKLELKPEHVIAIGEALACAPYKVAAPVIAELQRQINEQEAAAKAAAERKAEPSLKS